MWFRRLSDPAAGNVIVTARASIVEVYSAFNRRRREAGLGPADYAQLAADFDAVCAADYQLVELTPEVAQRAR